MDEGELLAVCLELDLGKGSGKREAVQAELVTMS